MDNKPKSNHPWYAPLFVWLAFTLTMLGGFTLIGILIDAIRDVENAQDAILGVEIELEAGQAVEFRCPAGAAPCTVTIEAALPINGAVIVREEE